MTLSHPPGCYSLLQLSMHAKHIDLCQRIELHMCHQCCVWIQVLTDRPFYVTWELAPEVFGVRHVNWTVPENCQKAHMEESKFAKYVEEWNKKYAPRCACES